jgi:hypothetical protein
MKKEKEGEKNEREEKGEYEKEEQGAVGEDDKE